MLYGEVPYKSGTIVDLLYDIKNVGPNYNHPNVGLSQKLFNLLKALLQPDPELRISHEDLFSIVINSRDFVAEYSNEAEAVQEKPAGSGYSSDIKSREDYILDSFIKDVIYQRSKYQYLVNLANQTQKFKT